MRKKMNPELETIFLEKKEQKEDSIQLKTINTNKKEIGIEAFDYFKDEINKSKKRYDNLFIENINQRINYLNLKKMALEINQIENKISKNIKYLTSSTKQSSSQM